MSKSKPKQPLLQQCMTADHWVRNGRAGHHYLYTKIELEPAAKHVDLVVSVVFAAVGFNPGWCKAAESDCDLVLHDFLRTLQLTRGTTRAYCTQKDHAGPPVDGQTAVTFRIRVLQGK